MDVVCHSHTHRKLFWLTKVIKRPIRPKLGMQSPSNLVTIISNHIWVWFCHSHTQEVVLAIKVPNRLKFILFLSNQVSIINHVGVTMGVFVATPTGSCLGFLRLMKGLNRLKFDMRFPSNWVSIINHMWE